MKKKTLLKLLFTASGLLAVVYSLSYNNEKNKLDNLAFQNVEALASGENDDNADCFGYGSIDCRTFKVELKITGFSLD